MVQWDTPAWPTKWRAMEVDVHTHARMHICMCTHTHACTSVHSHTETQCMHAHMYVHTCAHMRCVHAHTYVWAHMHICMYTHMHARTYVHTHTNTYLPYIEKKRKERRKGSVLLWFKQGIVGFYRNELPLHWAFSESTETLKPGWLSPGSGNLSSTYSRHYVKN